MAADVSSLTRMLSGFNEEQRQSVKIEESSSSNCSELITRDLLGSCSRSEAKELDLDLQVPSGWEKRLDLKSGAVYLQRCRSSSMSTSLKSSSDQHKHHHHHQQHQNRNAALPELQDLNLPPTSSSKTLLHEFEKRLDLKLVTTTHDYQSVCTLDMVKSALERAEIKKKKPHHHHRSEQRSSCSFDGSSSSSSSLTLLKEDEEEKRSSSSSSISCSNSSSLFAAGCSNCLMYVLMPKANPKCPRCHTSVVQSSSTINKKPRIDLNAFSN